MRKNLFGVNWDGVGITGEKKTTSYVLIACDLYPVLMPINVSLEVSLSCENCFAANGQMVLVTRKKKLMHLVLIESELIL